MPAIYVTADLHFGHKNIIAYENRTFSSVEEMDEALVTRWNEVVQPEDTVYLLGDVSFYGKEQTRWLVELLQGHKRLVMGNHDTHPTRWYRDCGFEEVYDCPILFREFFLLSHEPLYLNTNMPYGNIFGHVHGNPAYADASPQSCCVCVERTGYRPLSFDEVRRRMGLLPEEAPAEG